MRPARVASHVASSVARAVSVVDSVLATDRRQARVLVDVRTPMNLAVMRPVWKRLHDDPRVFVAFAAETPETVSDALRADKLDGRLLSRLQASWKRWDLALSADAWNQTDLSRCRRRMNFFHGVAGKYDLDNPGRLAAAELRRFDRIAFINRDRMERYLSAGIVSDDRAVLVGYPKSDDLFNEIWSARDVRASLGLAPETRTVLYAPTFSTSSSLHAAGIEIVDTLLDIGVNVIVKLHDRSMTPHPQYTGGIDWPARFAAFAESPGFALVRDADIGPYLAAADVLVTDHSTVGFEFAALDRPVIVFDVPELLHAARIDPDKWALLRSMADVVRHPDELRDAVTRADPARHREPRKRARALFAFPGTATERALAVVYELLERAGPDARPTRYP